MVAPPVMASLKDALAAYEQPVRAAIMMLERRGGAAAEVAEELRERLGDACDVLEVTEKPSEDGTAGVAGALLPG